MSKKGEPSLLWRVLLILMLLLIIEAPSYYINLELTNQAALMQLEDSNISYAIAHTWVDNYTRYNNFAISLVLLFSIWLLRFWLLPNYYKNEEDNNEKP